MISIAILSSYCKISSNPALALSLSLSIVVCHFYFISEIRDIFDYFTQRDCHAWAMGKKSESEWTILKGNEGRKEKFSLSTCPSFIIYFILICSLSIPSTLYAFVRGFSYNKLLSLFFSKKIKQQGKFLSSPSYEVYVCVHLIQL